MLVMVKRNPDTRQATAHQNVYGIFFLRVGGGGGGGGCGEGGRGGGQPPFPCYKRLMERVGQEVRCRSKVRPTN